MPAKSNHILETTDLTNTESNARRENDLPTSENNTVKTCRVRATVSTDRDLPPRLPPLDKTVPTHLDSPNTRTFDNDLETGLQVPEVAHIYGSTSWLTIWPRSQPVSPSASFSSGPTLAEAIPPEPALDDRSIQGLGIKTRDSQDDERITATVQEAEEDIIPHAVPPDPDYTEIATKLSIDKLLQDHPLPAVTGPEWWNKLRHGFLSMYRRLHIGVLLANFIALMYCTSQVAKYGSSHYKYLDASNGIVANLFVGTLMRHEHAINLFFRMCTMLPHSTPLVIRRYAAKVYSYGGIHSSCGISSLFWYIFYVILLLKQFGGYGSEHEPLLHVLQALTATMLMLFITLIVMAYPKIRSKYHNWWELSHRFAGWTSILVIWTQTLIAAWPIAAVLDKNVVLILIETPAFWFLLAISGMIIYPWLRLRRRAVAVEPLSDRAIRLRFHNRKVSSCVGTRLSRSPLMENHGFATIPNPNGEKGYSVIVSNAGDWTSKLIKTPPSHLWMRGAHTMGVSRIGLLFRPVIVAATGSGIGPTLSFLQAHPEWPCRVVWSATYPVETFGKEIMAAVLRADPEAVIVCRKQTGRYLMHELAFAAYKQFGAEAVVLISNPKETRRTVFELETRNVPAYGAIFDS